MKWPTLPEEWPKLPEETWPKLPEPALTFTALRDLLVELRRVPLVVRIDVASIDELRRSIGATPGRRTDVLGVADIAGVPVYVDDDIEPGRAKISKSDGSVEWISL